MSAFKRSQRETFVQVVGVLFASVILLCTLAWTVFLPTVGVLWLFGAV